MSKRSLKIITPVIVAAIFGTLMLYFQSQQKQKEVAQQSKLILPAKPADKVIAQAPLSQLPDHQELKNCDDVTVLDKHTIDDWLLTLQDQGLQSQWQQHISKLEVCLHQYAQAYLAYKQALTEIDENLNIFERHELLMTLQRQFFSPQLIERWFAQENNWNEHALQRWQILADQRINSEQKEHLISQHISQLPDKERQLITSSLALTTLSKNFLHKTPNDLIAKYGEEAAQRLVELKDKQIKWQQKLVKFEQRSLDILANNTTKSEQLQEIEKLKQTMFDSAEQKRLVYALAFLKNKGEQK
ncbi:lipase chaperone family protein [Pseudoalteromonas sp. S16_S37]|uniref:lipase chaperone family protein n=1 Tax=Pseudoalteromonas sp. S16_S37 TaxID=2720228 RepID=UPI0016804F08|nr:lipase chaperone family protein [Pseudoalteromonas sp. S16_S37]MBD1583944.1 lipase chaperone [Pseudoalteromonas sp. S16_S37]